MNQNDKDTFSERAREILDEQTENLDASTLSRLHQARSKALAGARQKSPWILWAPAGAVAAGILSVGIYLNQYPGQLSTGGEPPLPAIYQDPMEQIAAENMDLMDDLEFIAWLVLEESS